MLWVCVYRLRYPACKAHAPYCHLWPARLYNIFPQCLINGKIFEKKKVTEHKMCVSILCTTFVWNIFRSTKKWTRHDKKYILVWNVIYPLIFFADFNGNWIFSTDFRKYSNVKFHEDPCSCSKWMDRQALSSFANAPINKKGIADLL